MTTRTDGPDWFHTVAQDGGAPPGPEGDPATGAPVGGPRDPAGPDDLGDGLLDDDWVPQRRTNRLTRVLAVGVVAACTFTGGAVVEKAFGGSTATTAGTGTRGAFPGGEGFGAGGFPGGGFPGQTGQGAQTGQGTQAGQSGQAGRTPAGSTAGAGSTAAAAPAVVGTVKSVKGTDLVVENFGGKQITVHVPRTATVTTPGLSGVAAGMTVTVAGSAAADGTVTATSVVARSAS